ncbi:MAG: dimethylmenaquinone methyltransferase [Rubrivivax sp. SCN 71-131]|nr:MAG: dimethylmenaquinone methyltransferase [Rubrivivax sp. SCN 71-131]
MNAKFEPTGSLPAQPPHPLLHAYYDDEAGRHRFLRRIFDETAADYDRIERVLALGSGPWYRRMALQRAGLAPGQRMLDVGIGTGLVAREALTLLGGNGSVVGVDPSPGMMGQVDLPGVQLLQGRAEQLPCEDASFDFVCMGYALRHVGDVAAAFSEFLRVLRPGGRVLVLEISKPASRTASWLLKAYMRALVPLISRAIGCRRDSARLWRYYWDTIEACIPPRHILASLEAAGFTQVQRHVELGIFSEYTATRPLQ